MDKIITQNSELDELHHQGVLITDESLESTRRMVRMMDESEEAGKRTIESLDIQREQLKRIEQGMDHINADMTKVERSLKRLKRCCNVCTTPWNKVPAHDESNHELKNGTEKNTYIIVNQPQRLNGKKTPTDDISTNPSSGYITRITNDAREDEMESNLCQVNSILYNLRNMATDMNSELSRNIGQIEIINNKGNANNIRLDQANISANDLLKS